MTSTCYSTRRKSETMWELIARYPTRSNKQVEVFVSKQEAEQRKSKLTEEQRAEGSDAHFAGCDFVVKEVVRFRPKGKSVIIRKKQIPSAVRRIWPLTAASTSNLQSAFQSYNLAYLSAAIASITLQATKGKSREIRCSRRNPDQLTGGRC